MNFGIDLQASSSTNAYHPGLDTFPTYPTFAHYLSQWTTDEVARSERDAKKTAASAPRAAQRQQTKNATRTLVGQYLKCLNSSRADRMAEAHAKAVTPWPMYGFGDSDAGTTAPGTDSPLDFHVTAIIEKRKREAPLDEQELVVPTSDDDTIDSYIAKTKGKDASYVAAKNRYNRIPSKKQIVAAYVAMEQGKDGAIEKLYEVLSKYAVGVVAVEFSKTNHPKGNVEDVSQEILIRIFDAINDFKPKYDDPNLFYKWLDRIVKNAYYKAFNEAKATSMTDRPFFVNSGMAEEVGEVGGTNSGGPEVENFDIGGRNDVGSSFGILTNPLKYHLVIPEFIQGTDRKICTYIRAGKTYAEIGVLLEIGEPAVKLRLSRIRKSVEEKGLKKQFA